MSEKKSKEIGFKKNYGISVVNLNEDEILISVFRKKPFMVLLNKVFKRKG